MQIYLTHHLPPKGFIHSVRLYPALTPVRTVEEERGARTTKDSGNMKKEERGGKWRLNVERGTRDPRSWICGGLVMTGMQRGESNTQAFTVQHNALGLVLLSSKVFFLYNREKKCILAYVYL